MQRRNSSIELFPKTLSSKKISGKRFSEFLTRSVTFEGEKAKKEDIKNLQTGQKDLLQLPTIQNRVMSEKPVSNTKQYKKKFDLRINSQVLQTRQNQYYVNNYFQKMINKNVLKTGKPTPILAVEKAIRDSIDSHASAQQFSETFKQQILKRKQSVMTAFDDQEDIVNGPASTSFDHVRSSVGEGLQTVLSTNYQTQALEGIISKGSRALQSSLMDPFSGNSVISSLKYDLR